MPHDVNAVMDHEQAYVRGPDLQLLCWELFHLGKYGTLPSINGRQPKLHALADRLSLLTRNSHGLARTLVESAAVESIAQQHAMNEGIPLNAFGPTT